MGNSGRNGLKLLAAAIVACIAATACSSGDAEDDGQTTLQAPAAGQCTDLRFGVLTAFTGELGSFGVISQNAFDLAMKDIQDSSELPDGWTMSSVVMDEETNIEIGLRSATDLMQNQHVSAILGPSSGPIVAMDAISRRYQTPILSQFAGTTNFSSVGGDYIFRTVAADSSDGKAIVKNLLERNLDEVAVVVQNDQSTITAGQTVADRLDKVGGRATRFITYNPGQSSYLSVTQQAINELNDGAQAIYLAGGQESATTILRELRDRGVPSTKIIVSADLVVDEVAQGVGADWADGLTGVTASSDTERPQYKKMSERYAQEYGEDPGLFVENAYDALILVALAAVAGDSTCGADIAKHLPEVAGPPGIKVESFAEGAKLLKQGKDIDYDGASGPVDFDETGTVPGSYAVYELQDGSWTPTEFYGYDVLEN